MWNNKKMAVDLRYSTGFSNYFIQVQCAYKLPVHIMYSTCTPWKGAYALKIRGFDRKYMYSTPGTVQYIYIVYVFISLLNFHLLTSSIESV